jgi:hypothetical protein
MEQEKDRIAEVNRIINKINRDWERAVAGGNTISRIDKDILITDLKIAYELVCDLEVAKIYGTQKPSEIREKVPQTPISDPIPGFQISEKKDNESNSKADQLTIREGAPSEDAFVSRETAQPAADDPEPPKPATQQPENTGHDKQSAEEPRPESVPGQKPPQHAARVTADLFTPPKTVSDVFNGNGESTLAEKIKNNKIADIRTAIGINDKFTFINEIFKGELAKYNQAIEQFNSMTSYDEAIEFIGASGLATGTAENKQAIARLSEILKRKF